jgi:Flp pilus assembly protein TadB
MVFLENKSPAVKSSRHPSGRTDVLIKEFSEEVIGARKKRKMAWSVLAIIYVVAVFVAHYLWGAEIVFVTVFAAAAGMSPF